MAHHYRPVGARAAPLAPQPAATLAAGAAVLALALIAAMAQARATPGPLPGDAGAPSLLTLAGLVLLAHAHIKRRGEPPRPWARALAAGAAAYLALGALLLEALLLYWTALLLRPDADAEALLTPLLTPTSAWLQVVLKWPVVLVGLVVG